MAKVTLDTILSGFKSVTKFISNFSAIEDELNNKVLYRDNPSGEPNQMENIIDMNSNRIENLGEPTNTNSAARLRDVTTTGTIELGRSIVSDIATLKLLDGTSEQNVFLEGYHDSVTGGSGEFYWNGSNLSAEVAADPQSGVYVPPSAAPTGASGAWVRILNGYLTPQMFGAYLDDTTDDSVAIQAAHNMLLYFGGGLLLFTGTAYTTTGIELSPNNVGGNINIVWEGVGWNSGIRSSTDIEQVFYGDTTTTIAAIGRFTMQNIKIERDVTTVFTKSNIRITMPADIILDKVFVLNVEAASTNIGGVHFAASSATSYPGSVNQVINSRIQGGGLFMECRDSRAVNTWVWGQRTQYSVKSYGSGNVFNTVSGLSSPTGGSFNFNVEAIGNRMEGCTVDGSAATGSGHGVIADRAFGLQIVDCDLYTMADGHAIYLKDALRTVITGNTFKNNNLSDNFYNDIVIESITFPSNGVIIQGNSFYQPTKTNKGYAYLEVNGGSAPGPCKFIDNELSGAGYITAPISRLNTATEVRGNSGLGTEARRKGQVAMPAGTNPTVSISHGSQFDPLISELKILPSNNVAGAGITSWYAQRSSASVMTLFARGTVTTGATFEWEVDTL